MTMNSSGPISLGGSTAGQSINLENGFSATAQVSLNDTAVRNLAGVPSGAITMPTNFYGKSNRAVLNYTYSSNTANASLNLSALSGYISGKSDITITVDAGVYVYSTSTGSYGLNLSGGTTGDTLVIVNNGYIMGMGGQGADSDGYAKNANPGGPALNLGFGMSGCTINNQSGYITGGGGGGGSYNYQNSRRTGGGGGAGGGEGGTTGFARGAGGGPGQSGTAGGNAEGGGGGGRIVPGTGGARTQGGGAGGGGGGSQHGGAGGSGNSAGSNATQANKQDGGGGGGGWGAVGGQGTSGSQGSYTAGASGGKGINLNAKTITWTGGSASSSRVYGVVS